MTWCTSILDPPFNVPALQIRTVGELLAGQKFDLPFGGVNVSYKQAPQVEADSGQQGLELD